MAVQDKAGAPRVGQDAGITTDKLWEVASAQFAEDHREGWLQKLVDIKVCYFVDELAGWLHPPLHPPTHLPAFNPGRG